MSLLFAAELIFSDSCLLIYGKGMELYLSEPLQVPFHAAEAENTKVPWDGCKINAPVFQKFIHNITQNPQDLVLIWIFVDIKPHSDENLFLSKFSIMEDINKEN